MRGRRGFAQLLVLWALALLGTLALGFSFTMRTEALAARNGIDGTRAYFQARTGVDRALMLIATVPADNLARMEIAGEDDDASYVVRLDRESGKVDINFVPEEMLLGVLAGGGLPDDDAERLRDAILDWRDEDDVARPAGAEAGDYANLAEPVMPRNSRFQSVEELRYVMGVTPEFYRRFLSRVFTVHGNSPQLSFRHAPEIVLRSLPGISPGAVESILAGRSQDPPISAADLAAMAGAGEIGAQSLALLSGGDGSNVWTVTATGKAGDGVTRVVRCLAEYRGGGEKEVKILGWLEVDG
ncbi:MAG: general secretion pathway protein GspK [Deltaproteobacteria bacterium]|nr:general secretion pathway protein GspK [Deltaproteobacteria bacterium]